MTTLFAPPTPLGALRRSQHHAGPVYRVLLHNDTTTFKRDVVRVLVDIVHDTSDATGIMEEAHVHGQAVVTTCTRPEAEGHVRTLQCGGLDGTLEPY
jgi:ATP-dependent Clp protease adapter protein ClpS